MSHWWVQWAKHIAQFLADRWAKSNPADEAGANAAGPPATPDCPAEPNANPTDAEVPGDPDSQV